MLQDEKITSKLDVATDISTSLKEEIKKKDAPEISQDIKSNIKEKSLHIENKKITQDLLGKLVLPYQANPEFENLLIKRCFFEEKSLETLGKFVGTHPFMKSFEWADTRNCLTSQHISLLLNGFKESKTLVSVALKSIIFDDDVAKSLSELLKSLNSLKNLTVTNQFTYDSNSTLFGKRVSISKGFSFNGLELIAIALKSNNNLQNLELRANAFAKGFANSQVNKIYSYILANLTLLQFDLQLLRDPRVDYSRGTRNCYWDEEEVFVGRISHLDQGNKFLAITARNKMLDDLINKRQTNWPDKTVIWNYAAVQKLFSIENYDPRFLFLDKLVEIKQTISIINNYLENTSSLITLNLSNALLNVENIQKLCGALKKNRSVTELHLANTDMDDTHVVFIAELLDKDCCLPLGFLNLSRNHLTFKGLSLIAKRLVENTQLYHLNIRNNQVNGEGLNILAEALIPNRHLTTLDLLNNLEISLLPEKEKKEQLDKNLRIIEEFISILNPPMEKAKKNLQNKRKSTSDGKNKNTTLTHINLIPPNASRPPNYGVYQTKVNIKYYEKKEKEIEKIGKKLKQYLDENIKKSGELIRTITLNNLPKFTNLLKEVSLFTFSESGDSLLHLAVNQSALEILQELIRRKINPHLLNKNRLMAIEICKEEGKGTKNDQEIFNFLDSYHADFFSSDSKASKTITEDPQKKRQKISVDSPPLSPFKPLEPGIKEDKSLRIDSLSSTSSSSSSGSSSMGSILFSNIAAVPIDETVFFDLIMTGGKFQLIKAIKNQPQLTIAYGSQGLHLAIQNGQKDCTTVLLDYGVSVEGVDERKYDPLYSIASDPDNENLDMALLLIRRGAKPSIPTYDHEFKVNKFTGLHKVVATGKYRLMKIFLSSPYCNPNLTDENQLTTLDWAVDRYHLPMLSRLLIDRRMEPVTIQRCLNRVTQHYKNDKINPNFQTIEKLLKDSLQLKIPDQHPGIQWTRRLQIVFGSNYGKNKKTVVIDSEAEHATLCLQNEFSRQRLFKLVSAEDEKEQEDVKGNPVTASLIFIASGKKYVKGVNEQRITLRIGLDFIDKHHFDLSIVDAKQKQDELIHRVSSAPPAFFTHPAKNRKKPPLTPAEIKEKYKQVETEGAKKGLILGLPLHHGEQALLSHLEDLETVKKIVTSLAQQPQFVQGCKIYGVILNIHSPRYCCENCEAAILGEQNYQKSKFLQALSLQLKQIGCVLPVYSDLRMLTQVSSYIPFHRDPIENSEEMITQVDFRACNNDLILEKDLNSVEPQATQYHSRQSLVM